MEDITARKIIDILRGSDGRKDLELLCSRPSDWTLDEVEEMTVAAASNTSVTRLRLTPEKLSHITVAPFLELLRNSSALKKINISKGFPMAPAPVPMIVDMIFQAALRNGSLNVTELIVEAFGDPQLFQRFLQSSNKLEMLWISTRHETERSISSETALALATGIHSLDSLKTTHFIFHCDDEALRLITASLHGHPNLENVFWNSQLDAGTFSGLLALCASCPKIKDYAISPTGLEEYNVAPLLHGLRFGETLEELSLSRMVIRDADPVYSFPSNNTLRHITFGSVNFEGNSLSGILRHFPGLKKVIFDECEGVSATILENVTALEGLDELDFYCHDNEAEENHLVTNISHIVSQGPPNMSFTISSVTRQVVSSIAEGLQLREEPMKKFNLCDSWEVGALDLFRTDVLPLLSDVEELSLDYSDFNPSLERQGEIRRFFGSLLALKKLKELYFGCSFPTRDAADSLVTYLKQSEVLTQIDGVYFAEGLEWADDKIDHYIDCNRYGRQHLRNLDIPVGVWPRVLAGITDDEEDSVMFEFLRILNGSVDLFRNSHLTRKGRMIPFACLATVLLRRWYTNDTTSIYMN